VKLVANEDPNGRDQAALRMANAEPLWLEIQDAVIEDSRVEVLGAGTVRVQAVSFMPHGRVTSSLLVDHPDAHVTMVGGNITNHRVPIRVDPAAASHVHQRRGRLRIFGTGLQATIGPSDVRIESPADSGPHALIGIRSEGANGVNQGTYPCRLLAVPATPAPVDVVIESTGQVCGPLGRNDGALATYEGQGTLWLVGNNIAPGARSLVIGAGPAARVIGLGNLVQGDALLTSPGKTRSDLVANLEWRGRRLQGPAIRHTPMKVEPPKSLESVPSIEVPPALTRPRVTRALPGMLDARRFGAVGDGVHDDTGALQHLLDVGCGQQAKVIFLGPGHYRITKPLRFNHEKASCSRHGLGGWFAGAGSDQTFIRREGAEPGGTFVTQGMAYATLQGITFQTAAYGTQGVDGASAPAFALENKRGIGPASQGNSFHDVRFEGGSSALAIGVESSEQCSENLLVGVSFSKARYGMAVGAYNALANIVYGGHFEDNEITVGHPEVGLSGGTWILLDVRVRGTRDREFNFRNSATGVWYVNAIDSDTPRLVSVGGTGAAFPVVLEHAALAPRSRPPGQRFILFGGGGGFTLLHSRVTGLAPSLMGGTMAGSYLIGVESTLGGLSGVTAGPNAVITNLGSASPDVE
jgi:hypothetical protein